MVSFRNKSDRIQRSHLLTLDMKVSLTGKNISDAVYGIPIVRGHMVAASWLVSSFGATSLARIEFLSFLILEGVAAMIAVTV